MPNSERPGYALRIDRAVGECCKAGQRRVARAGTGLVGEIEDHDEDEGTNARDGNAHADGGKRGLPLAENANEFGGRGVRLKTKTRAFCGGEECGEQLVRCGGVLGGKEARHLLQPTQVGTDADYNENREDNKTCGKWPEPSIRNKQEKENEDRQD